MKRLIYLVAFVSVSASFSSCSSTYQIVEVKSSDCVIRDGFYVHENDSVKVVYNFYAERGIMMFSIINKLQKPIYIDWYKSALIVNGYKISYWQDVSTTSTTNISEDYLYQKSPIALPSGTSYGVFNLSTGLSSTVKPERITFLAPSSGITNYMCRLTKVGDKLPLKNGLADTTFLIKTYYTDSDATNDYSKAVAKVYTTNFVFRNYITYSLDEKGENSYQIDNKFYSDRLSQIVLTSIDGLASGKNPRSFYLKVKTY